MTSNNPAPESPEIFKLLVQQVNDCAIFALDNDGHICSWNEGARRINGYEPEEILGRHFSILYSPPDLKAEKPAFELRMAREMGRYEEEDWRLRKDGSRFWANIVITPLLTSHGNPNGYAKVVRDLTSRKLQEEQFDTEERFRSLVEQVKDYAIFFLDPRGSISSWNQGARRIKGYAADEILGQHFSTFYTPEDLAMEKPARALIIAAREGRYEEEGWRVKKDGSRFWASVVITSLRDNRGNLSGFAKVTRDLTVRKVAEEALRSRTDEMEAFAHTLSHDLRAPVRSISSFAQVLLDDAELSPEHEREYLENIFRSAQSMEALIRDVLKLSQVSLAPADKESVPLKEVVQQAIHLIDHEIRMARATIHVGPLPVVQANRTLLLQIFSNLISNAVKFVRPGRTPEVEVFARARGGAFCEIHVLDSGPGIPEEFHPAVFKVFNRGAADSASSGTGIGLAIVKKAAERSGGNVELHSRPGEGSDFVVTLPCEIAQLASA